jgi:hemerythrin superfamily protein
MDAITLLRDDHKTVEQLFKRFEKAGDRAYVEKRQIVDRIIEELSIHAAIEEQVFYPVARATVADTEDIALESLEEHHIVKWLLSELVDLDPAAERFDAKVTVLIENVRHHVEEEQDEFFPKVRQGLSRAQLADLGEALANAKKTAPTHPHPRSPDTPPGNSVAGTIAGVIDRVGDNISGMAQGGVTAAQDLIARILNTNKPKVSPTGTTAARTTAKHVRRSATTAADGVEATARSAKTGATKTLRAATTGAKGTVTTAKKSARSTTTTAKRAATTTGRTAKKATRATVTTAKRAAVKV